jgi:hypothetical protein
MSKTVHIIYITTLVGIVVLTFLALLDIGMPYYMVNMEERFYHPDYNLLKPSGILGHGMGIIGSLLIVIGVSIYMARKRYRIFSRLGILKYWLEFHIFLCTLGPLLIVFHTSFKVGGLVAISFWSMVAVFLSGVIGRFIYIQIPRSIEGRELSLAEVRGLKTDVAGTIMSSYNINEESFKIISESTKKKIDLYHFNPIIGFIRKYNDDRKSYRAVKAVLRKNKLPGKEKKKILGLVRDDILLNRKIDRLDLMQKMFQYWHVIHSPFALVMLIIMLIHVAVTIVLGYRWIF